MNDTVVPIQCSCGKVTGELRKTTSVNRVTCYCEDCQAFAHFLDRTPDILDQSGGTHIVQTTPDHLTFTKGKDHLACMRLSDRGLLRWYTDCCNTPIGNTANTAKFSFVGLIHSCIKLSPDSLNQVFGSSYLNAHTKYAKGGAFPPRSIRTELACIGRILRGLAQNRITGRYKDTPFFDIESDVPVTTPRVLTDSELEAIRCKLSV